MISISKLETINTSQQWVRSGARVDIGSSVVVFEEECDAQDAVDAINSVDDVVEIINAAKRLSKAIKDDDKEEIELSKSALIELIDGVGP